MKKYNPNDSLTQRERSIIVGSILGDGYISRGIWKGVYSNARITFIQGIAQLPYLEWKQEELKRWIGTTIRAIPYKTQFGGTVHQLATTTHPLFTEIFHAIYPDGGKIKRISPQVLNWLDDLALAVWFMDDGTGCYSDAKIATYALLHSDIDIVSQYLSAQGMYSKRMDTGKGPILSFSARGKDALYAHISSHIHPILKYKLGSTLPRTCVFCGSEFFVRIAGGYSVKKLPITCSRSCATRLGHANYPDNWRRRK